MRIVSAAQFVDGLIAALCLQGKTALMLDDPALDRQFATAYDELLGKSEELGLAPDFVISADPAYGDSTCLRDAILDIRDSGSVAVDDPRSARMTMRFAGHNTPESVLGGNAVPRWFLERLASEHLAMIAR
jgi:hypothetical protein